MPPPSKFNYELKLLLPSGPVLKDFKFMVFRKTYWMLWLLLIFLLSSYYPEMVAPHDSMMIRWMDAYKDGKGIQRRPNYK